MKIVRRLNMLFSPTMPEYGPGGQGADRMQCIVRAILPIGVNDKRKRKEIGGS